MRINEISTKEMLWSFIKFYQLIFYGNNYLCIEISVEILFVDLGALRVIAGEHLYFLQGQQLVQI